MHGGGYVFGSYASDNARLDGWSSSYRCAGVSVDYRLAPETPFPGPLDDCYLGLKWVFDHHDELGVDLERIGVSGTSAGAGLAAGLALLARDRGEVPLQFQLLDAPMIDDRQVTPSSQRDDLVIFDREANEFGWRSYLGDLYGNADVPAYAAPARAADLGGLLRPISAPGTSTGSVTTPSATPPGSTRPACQPTCTSNPAPRTGSSNSLTSPSRTAISRASTSGSAPSSRHRRRPFT
jgi:acetyl esterase/lipase